MLLNRILRVILVLPAILFLSIGLRWVVDPATAASALGMPLLDGLGRSSQIGDVGALFISMGLFILLAVVTLRRPWFLAPAIMLFTIALYRILAWLVHGAEFAPPIAVEIVVATLLLVAARRLSVVESAEPGE